MCMKLKTNKNLMQKEWENENETWKNIAIEERQARKISYNFQKWKETLYF